MQEDPVLVATASTPSSGLKVQPVEPVETGGAQAVHRFVDVLVVPSPFCFSLVDCRPESRPSCKRCFLRAEDPAASLTAPLR